MATISRNQQKKIGIIGLIALVIIAWSFVIYESIKLHELPPFHAHSYTIRNLLQERSQHIQPKDASFIQSWMTFDYINAIYHLPPTLLQTNLAVTDSHYPHLTLQKYATENHSDTTTVVTSIRKEVSDFLSQHP